MQGHGFDSFNFSMKDFRSVPDSHSDFRLTAMQTFKDHFSEEIIRYQNSVSTEEIAAYYGFDAQEHQLLKELVGE